MAAFRQKELRQIINHGLAVTDGMPLVWLCRSYGNRNAERVYGPDFMLALCRYGIDKKYRHFFYGGGPGTAEKLAASFRKKFPGILIAGTYTPSLLNCGEMEVVEVIDKINSAKPDIIWIGLGTPKQDFWLANHRKLLNAPVLAAVGAAFDFHSGRLPQAPAWMQKNGLEWFFRLLKEPRRLMARYFIYNPLFITCILMQITGLYRFEGKKRPCKKGTV